MKDQVKTAHFWLMLIGVIVGGLLEVGLVPDGGTAHKLAALSIMVLNALGIQVAAKWQPAPKPMELPPPPKAGEQ